MTVKQQCLVLEHVEGNYLSNQKVETEVDVVTIIERLIDVM
jgi:hypothetical protein